MVAGALAGFDAGRCAALVDAVHAQRAAFDAALAARHLGLLVGERLVHEGACLVRAGHHAIAAADATVAVDQHDAVGALEGRAGRAHVDAGRLGAVLAHHRQRSRAAGPDRLESRPCGSTARRSAGCRPTARFRCCRPGRNRCSRWRTSWCRSAGPNAPSGWRRPLPCLVQRPAPPPSGARRAPAARRRQPAAARPRKARRPLRPCFAPVSAVGFISSLPPASPRDVLPAARRWPWACWHGIRSNPA